MIKQSLLTALVLGYPDPELTYIPDTDAFLDGIGAVLSQAQDGKERVVSFYSSVLGMLKETIVSPDESCWQL